MKVGGIVSLCLGLLVLFTMVSDSDGAGRRGTKRTRVQWADSSDEEEEDDRERGLPTVSGPAVASMPAVSDGDGVDSEDQLNGVAQMGASWDADADAGATTAGAGAVSSGAVGAPAAVAGGAVASGGTGGAGGPSVPAAPVLRSYETCEGGARTLFSMGRPDFCSTSVEEGGRAGWERYKRLYSRNIYTPAGRISRGFLRLVDPNDPMLGRYAYEDAVEEEAAARREDAEARLRLRLADSRARHFRDAKAEGYPEAVAEAAWEPKEKEFRSRGMARIAEEEKAWRDWVWKWLRATAIVTYGCSGGKKDDESGDRNGDPDSDSDGSSGSTSGGGKAGPSSGVGTRLVA